MTSKYSLGRRYLERPGRGWDDVSKMDVTEIGCEDWELVDLAQDHVQWRA